MINQIANSAEDQSAALEQITKAINELSKSTQQAAAIAEETSSLSALVKEETNSLNASVKNYNL